MFQRKTLIIAGFLALTPIAVGTLAALTGLASGPGQSIDVIGFDRKWLLSVDEARALIASGALVIDARRNELNETAPVRNAARLTLTDFTGSDEAVTERLQALGLNRDTPVVVLGDPARELGDDAGIVMALRNLGHTRVASVDGGLPALVAAGLPAVQPPFGRGNFEIRHDATWSVDAAQVKSSKFQMVEGSLSADLLTPDGRLKTADQVAAILSAKGIDRDTPVAASGTGSAWLTTVLLDQGYEARQVVDGEYSLTAAN